MQRRHFLGLCTGLLLAPSLILAGEKRTEQKKGTMGRVEILDPPVRDRASQPAVVEFFSFYCPPCYAFSHQFGIDKSIRDILPPGKHLVKYHVDFLGRLGSELTKAWSIAMLLGIEDKIEPLLFYAAQVEHSLNSSADIRAVFEKTGVKGEEYDRLLENKLVKSKTNEQRMLLHKYQVKGTPAVFVNGRYYVNNGGFSGDSVEQYRKEFVSTVGELLKKEP